MKKDLWCLDRLQKTTIEKNEGKNCRCYSNNFLLDVPGDKESFNLVGIFRRRLNDLKLYVIQECHAEFSVAPLHVNQSISQCNSRINIIYN